MNGITFMIEFDRIIVKMLLCTTYFNLGFNVVFNITIIHFIK